MARISGFKGRFQVALANGTLLTCQHCSGQIFGHRMIKLNTTGATLLDFDWANISSEGFVCAGCGRIYEFAAGFTQRQNLPE